MYFELITGGAGSGKSAYIENEIRNSISSGKHALVIVPERFSHIQEKTMCDVFGGLGQNGIEVTTFSKMSRKLLEAKNHLSGAGRKILIMKAAKKNQDAGEGIFSHAWNKNGFLTELSSTVSELKKTLIQPEELTEYYGGGLAEKKLHAVGAMYKTYNEMIAKGFHDPDDDMQRLSHTISESELFENTDIYIDGFSDFLPSHYCVIEALIRKASGVLVSLMITDSGLRSNQGIFTPVRKSVDSLRNIAACIGLRCIEKHFDGEPSYITAGDIKYFISTYDEFNPVYEVPEAENIRIVRLNDRHEEITWLAGRIMYEIRENGRRFRDIGVIVGNLDSYAHIIDAVFNETGISYFADRKLMANEHAIIRLVLSVFRIINEDWSYNSVFEYLRSGFVYEKCGEHLKCISASDIDKLDIYVRTRGIKGKKRWLGDESWKPKRTVIFDTNPEETDPQFANLMDELRRKYMIPFKKLTDKIKGRQRVKALCTALFEFLDDIHLYEGLVNETKRMENEGMLNDAARISAVWNCLVETLEQCVVTCGDEYVSREEFSLMLEAALSECSIDTVPTGIDCVNIADSADSRPVKVKVLFAVGALRGEFPKENSDGGLINDKDRAELSLNGFDALADFSSKNAVSEFNIFHSLTGASEKLYVSYPEFNDDNTKNAPCALISDITEIFPEITAVYPSCDEMYENIFTSRKSTYYKMLSRIVLRLPEEEMSFWKKVSEYVTDGSEELSRTYYPQKTEYGKASVFELVKHEEKDIFGLVDEYKKPAYEIRPETAGLLYDSQMLSITSMQLFSKCPFAHFVRYGLKVLPEEEYRLKSYELGQVIHHAINEFCTEVQKGADTLEEKRQQWLELDLDDAKRIVDGLLSKIEQKAKADNPDFGSEKIEAMCKRAAKTIMDAVDVICKSVIDSGFSACDFERPFTYRLDDGERSASVQGKIDRIDVGTVGDDTYIRIIDYKTGRQEFKMSGICNMTDIQLIMYAIAAEELYKENDAKTAAVLYSKVKEELATFSADTEASAPSSKLNGIVITDSVPEEALPDELSLHDKALAQASNSSSYLNLKTKTNGCLVKNKTAISREDFDKIESFVKNGIIEIKDSVLGGDISVRPLSASGNTPCKYCGYAQICLFDSERDSQREAVTSEAVAWEIIGGDNKDE